MQSFMFCSDDSCRRAPTVTLHLLWEKLIGLLLLEAEITPPTLLLHWNNEKEKNKVSQCASSPYH